MDDDVRNENLKLYRHALSESSDEDQRRVLLVLLKLLLLEQDERASPPAELTSGFPSDHEPVTAARSPRARS